MPQRIRLNQINAETDIRVKQQLRADRNYLQVRERVEEALLAQDVTELLQIGG
jgi:hypothetical protein